MQTVCLRMVGQLPVKVVVQAISLALPSESADNTILISKKYNVTSKRVERGRVCGNNNGG